MLPSVDLPAPFGPMMACTSPAFTSSERPLRMSLPATRAWRLSIFSMSLSVSCFRRGRPGAAREEDRVVRVHQPAQLDGAFFREPLFFAKPVQRVHRAVQDAFVRAFGHREARLEFGVAELDPQA